MPIENSLTVNYKLRMTVTSSEYTPGIRHVTSITSRSLLEHSTNHLV